MKIKFIKNPIALNIVNVIGDEVDLDNQRAKFLVENGYAEEVKKPVVKKTTPKKK